MSANRHSDRVPTFVLRGLSALTGSALALALIFLDAREKMSWSQLSFAIGGVSFLLGFGFGGDVWGARAFRLFWHFDPHRLLEKNAELDGPANGSQPVREKTNHTSSTDGSRR